MSAELIGILSVGIAVAALILTRMHSLHEQMRADREEMRAEYRYLRDNQECLRKDADNGIRAVRGECQAGIDGLHDELLGRCKEWRDDVRCMIDLLFAVGSRTRGAGCKLSYERDLHRHLAALMDADTHRL